MEKEKNAPSRLVWVNSLKGWLITLVVLGHAIQWTLGKNTDNSHIWNFIYSFHIPAFMAVSGWLYYRPSQPENRFSFSHAITRRAQQLLVPYFCWTLLEVIDCRDIIGSFAYLVMYPDESFWFLWCLFFIFFFFASARWLAQRMNINDAIMIILMGALLIAVMMLTQFRKFGFQFISFHYLFFTLGYFIHRYPSLQTKNQIKLTALFLSWSVLAWYWKIHELPSWMADVPAPTAAQYAYRGVTASIAIVFLINIAPCVFDSKGMFNSCIATLGTWSLGIYTAHFFILDNLKAMLRHFVSMDNEALFMTLFFSISFGFALLASFLMMKNKYLARFFMGKL